MISVLRRPNLSEIQPMTPRPVPLTIAFSDIAVATIPPAKPMSLPNGTWKAMPKMLIPAVHSRQNHIIHRTGVRAASFGVYCLTAGGVFSSARRIFGSSVIFSGSTCGGHQFFGGSLKNQPANATTAQQTRPTVTRTPRYLLRSMYEVNRKTKGTEP